MRPGRKWLAAGVLTGLVGAFGVALAWLDRDPWPVVQTLAAPATAQPLEWADDGRLLSSGVGGVFATDPRTGICSAVTDEPILLGKSFDREHRHFLATSFAGSGRRAVVWGDAASGAVTRRFAVPSQVFHPVLEPDERSIRAFARDVAYPHRIREVVTWDIASGAETRRPITGPAWASPSLYSEAVSRDGRVLAYVDRSRHGVLLWDTDTDRPIGEMFATSLTALTQNSAATFAPDGHQLILSRTGGGLEVWEVSGSLVRRFVVHPSGSETYQVEISPDGRTLAASGTFGGGNTWRDQAVRWIWSFFPAWRRHASYEVVLVDLATGQRLARSRGSTSPLFSPDGRQIVTQEPDGTCALRTVPRRDDR